MIGLDPVIHALPTSRIHANDGVDHRVEPGDDELRQWQLASVATEFAQPDSRVLDPCAVNPEPAPEQSAAARGNQSRFSRLPSLCHRFIFTRRPQRE